MEVRSEHLARVGNRNGGAQAERLGGFGYGFRSERRFVYQGQKTSVRLRREKGGPFCWGDLARWARFRVRASSSDRPLLHFTFYEDVPQRTGTRKSEVGSCAVPLRAIIDAPLEEGALPPYASTGEAEARVRAPAARGGAGGGAIEGGARIRVRARALRRFPSGAAAPPGDGGERAPRAREEMIGTGETLRVAAVMRAHGCRLHNCRKNIGKTKYSLKIFARKYLPYSLKPPPGTCGDGPA
jgi:hypothetical protein